MKKGFKHIAIIYLLVIVVFASNGFQVYSSFCHCSQTETYTIFTPNTCCDEENEQSCDSQTLKNLCCRQSSVFIKFSEQYVPSFSSTEVKAICTVYLCAFSASALEKISENKSFSILSDKTDVPNLYGKTMVYRFHSIKIPCS